MRSDFLTVEAAMGFNLILQSPVDVLLLLVVEPLDNALKNNRHSSIVQVKAGCDGPFSALYTLPASLDQSQRLNQI